MTAVTLSDKMVMSVLDELKSGPEMKPLIGKTSMGNLKGHCFTTQKNAIVKIQSFLKDGGKKARFVLSITPKDSRPIEITGKYAIAAWKIITNPKVKKEKHSEAVINDAMAALGLS